MKSGNPFLTTLTPQTVNTLRKVCATGAVLPVTMTGTFVLDAVHPPTTTTTTAKELTTMDNIQNHIDYADRLATAGSIAFLIPIMVCLVLIITTILAYVSARKRR